MSTDKEIEAAISEAYAVHCNSLDEVRDRTIEQRGFRKGWEMCAASPAAVMAGDQDKQTDLAKRLLEKAHKCSDQFNAITVTKADLIAICCEANRYYTGMLNWKASAEMQAKAAIEGDRQPAMGAGSLSVMRYTNDGEGSMVENPADGVWCYYDDARRAASGAPSQSERHLTGNGGAGDVEGAKHGL